MGGSVARLVRTPQAEKHISALLESSSVTIKRCTVEGAGEAGVRGVRTETKQVRDKRASQSPQSAAVFTVASAGLADKFSPNMTQRSAAVQNRPLPTLLAHTQDSNVNDYLL